MGQNENSKNKFNIDFDALKQLVDLVKTSKIGRVKVSCDGFELEVESARQQNAAGLSVGAVTCLPDAAVTADNNFSSEQVELESGNLVSAPIVGTFYSAPAPGEPAFVQVGSSVKKGDILYIIESMKLMNEVRSEFEGTVKKIFVSDGDPVEYGQSIMLIE